MDTSYVIDPSDCIIAVDEPWIAFARANGAAPLVDRVIGQSLWTFIADVTVRELYRTLLARVRETSERVSLPFRCDSPAVRRFMRLSVGPGAGPHGTLAFRASLVGEEPQPIAARAIYAALPTAARRDRRCAATVYGITEPLAMCSTCKRLDVDGWYEIDKAVARRLDLLIEPVAPITHGLCPDCGAAMLAILA